MNLFRKGALSLCALLSLSFAMPAQQASAEGFSTYLEGSARAMSLAGGIVARGGDPSVISYNPAAMTRLEGTQIQGNLAVTQMYWVWIRPAARTITAPTRPGPSLPGTSPTSGTTRCGSASVSSPASALA